MTDCLFVYGTLLSGAGNAMSKRLAREAWSLGPAHTSGRLYDFGKWPGLRQSKEDELYVHGEVYRLNEPATSLAWLDAYEGIGPEVLNPEYRRLIGRAELSSGLGIETWIYVYQWSTEAGRELPDGRWLERSQPTPPSSLPMEPVAWTTGSEPLIAAQAA